MGDWLLFDQKKLFFLVRNANFKKMIFNYDVMMTYETFYDAQFCKVINRAKFDVYTRSSFGGVKVHARVYTLKDRIGLYIFDIF